MGDVVDFSGPRGPGHAAAPADSWSPACLVTLLEELLAEARAGKYTCLGVAMVSHDGSICSAFSTTGTPHAHHLTAAALYLLRRAEKNSECG